MPIPALKLRSAISTVYGRKAENMGAVCDMTAQNLDDMHNNKAIVLGQCPWDIIAIDGDLCSSF
jgi:hypothetical protein